MNFRSLLIASPWYLVVICNSILLTSAYNPPECLKLCLSKGRFEVPSGCQQVGCYCDVEKGLDVQQALKKCLETTCVGDMNITENILECSTSAQPSDSPQRKDGFDPVAAILGGLPEEAKTAPTGTQSQIAERTSFSAATVTPGSTGTFAAGKITEPSLNSTTNNGEASNSGLSSEIKLALILGIPFGFLLISVNAFAIIITLRKRNHPPPSLEKGDLVEDDRDDLPDNRIMGQSNRCRGFCEGRVTPSQIGIARYPSNAQVRSKSMHEQPSNRWTVNSYPSIPNRKSTTVARENARRVETSDKAKGSDATEGSRQSSESHASARTYLSESSQCSKTEGQNDVEDTEGAKKTSCVEKKDTSALPLFLQSCYEDEQALAQRSRSLQSSRSRNTVHTIKIHPKHRSESSVQPAENISC